MRDRTPKRTPAQLHKREAALLQELCASHGYSFSRPIRTVMLADRRGKRLRFSPGVILELMIPSDCALAEQLREYESANPIKKKGKGEARPLSKIGAGPT